MSQNKKNTLIESPIVLGGNVFGWTLDEKESFKILDAYYDLGMRTIDTANIYSLWIPGNDGSESEKIIGKWMKERNNREEIQLITKVGGTRITEKPDLAPQTIESELNLSLKHLQTDYIDLYFTHYDDESTSSGTILETYAKFKEEGKIKAIGASNISKERLEESLQFSKDQGILRYEVLQPEYNLYDREGFESIYRPIVEKENLEVIPYFSLASGFLSGKYQSPEDFKKYPRGGGVQQRYDNPRGSKVLQALKEVAEENQVGMAAVALAWLLKHPFISGPIASATKISHVEDFAKARDLMLSEADFSKLSEASSY